MKKNLLLVFIALWGAALCAQPEQPNLGLIPTPQQVVPATDGKSCVLAKAKIKEQQVKYQHANKFGPLHFHIQLFLFLHNCIGSG